MNNEPVAWMFSYNSPEADVITNEFKQSGLCDCSEYTIPLYTHPAELTDEEILEIASPMFEDARYPSTALDFARAILRKAQEK